MTKKYPLKYSMQIDEALLHFKSELAYYGFRADKDIMKFGIKFFLRLFSILLITILLQSNFLEAHADPNPISPPPTQSPQDTYSAFINNTNDAYSLIMDAHKKSQAEGGLRASEEVLTLAHQAEEAMERAVETLNLEGIPIAERKSQGIELVLLLRETLDRIERPDVLSIPNAQVVRDKDLDRWEIPHTQIAIVKKVGSPKAVRTHCGDG